MRRYLPLVLIATSLVLSPAQAQAAFGFAPGSPTIQVLDAAAQPYAEAGGHPDRLEVTVGFENEGGEVDENPRELALDFPPGFSGDPGAVPTCSRRIFEGDDECPPESQVGVVTVRFSNGSNTATAERRLLNVEPAPGEPAVLGFELLGKSPLTMRLRPGDFGLAIEQRDVLQPIPALEVKIELWGVPADHQEGTAIPRRPFVTLPTRCDRGPLALTVRASSWQHPERTVTASADTGVPLAGCAGLPFEPGLAFDLANPQADSPTGATLDLIAPQSQDPDGHAAAAIEGADVALPEGVAISAAAAGGLSVCPDDALHLGSEQPAACPPSARVGSVEFAAPQLRAPLRGDVYLGEEHPGERFRLFLVAAGMGVSVKLVGALRIDPVTGRIKATFAQMPEVSFSRIRLRLDDGPRALLATPLGCGPLTASARFESYSDAPAVEASDRTAVERGAGGEPCGADPPFAPGVSAGTTSARAGRATGLTLTLSRRAGEQLPDRFRVSLPSGLSASTGSVEVCGAALAAIGSCPPASRLGSAVGEVGSGPSPARLDGDVYFAGRHRGAPFSLALVFRAKLGPFDLGTLVVRAALRIDPVSGRLTVESDSLPRTVEGIPVRFQTIGLDLDRPGFLRNPTSCAPTGVEAEVRSATGSTAGSSTPFAVRGCDSLRFAPRLSMRLLGRKQLRAGGRPGLRIGIRAPRGGANLRSVDVALPELLRRNGGGVRELCARQAALEARCPDASTVGAARGRSPIAADDLSGPIHLVQPEGNGPPELWTSLAAEGFRFDLRSEVLVRAGRIHTKLTALPDVPLSEFAMRLDGGEHGLLSLETSPCAPGQRRSMAKVAFEGHNHAYLLARRRVEHPRCPGSHDAEPTSDRGRRPPRHG